jgi:hypothetical protein
MNSYLKQKQNFLLSFNFNGRLVVALKILVDHFFCAIDILHETHRQFLYEIKKTKSYKLKTLFENIIKKIYVVIVMFLCIIIKKIILIDEVCVVLLILS